jgi:hypothetical protein
MTSPHQRVIPGLDFSTLNEEVVVVEFILWSDKNLANT